MPALNWKRQVCQLWEPIVSVLYWSLKLLVLALAVTLAMHWIAWLIAAFGALILTAFILTY